MKLPKLNLPEFEFIVKTDNDKPVIFDHIRRQYVSLTPEEWVRQNFIKYLIECLHFPANMISIEETITIGKVKKRCDAIVYNHLFNPVMIIECKKTSIDINQKIFDQISRYNTIMQVPNLVITNGLKHYYFKANNNYKSFDFEQIIPFYENLKSKDNSE